MRPSEALLVRRAAIRPIVEAHRAINARVFGSVVCGDDTDDSDLDILIDPASRQWQRCRLSKHGSVDYRTGRSEISIVK